VKKISALNKLKNADKDTMKDIFAISDKKMNEMEIE